MFAEDLDPPALTFSTQEKAKLRSSFPYFCEKLLKINPKIKELVRERDAGEANPARGPLIPFVWNEAQREVWRVICEELEAGGSQAGHPQSAPGRDLHVLLRLHLLADVAADAHARGDRRVRKEDDAR